MKSATTASSQRQVVAAVCFRILSTGVEFLLVRTRKGRWTFPKGGVDEGLTHAQSAALEAYEEAGVHGRVEEVPFTRYSVRKARYEEIDCEEIIHAHLCEVLRQGAPQELNRNPTWFTSQKAKRQLAQGRTEETAAELARVLDRAVARVARLPLQTAFVNDPLFTVRLEAVETNLREAQLALKGLPSLPSASLEYRATSNTSDGQRGRKVLHFRKG
jgi:8-oxo-dGTP pyrophosphatase MutT (NUDIX family)